MARQCVIGSKDGLVTAHSSWVFSSSSHEDILSLQTGNNPGDYPEDGETVPVFLQQDPEDEMLPCELRLQCAPGSCSDMAWLQVVSEARTMEVYCGSEYCGTCRGERVSSLQINGVSDSISLYRKQLKLDSPSRSCEVKLLSLGGQKKVGISRIVVGVKPAGKLGSPPCVGSSIDLQRVRAMMESMGTTLSPGAQNLMDMVQFQQENKPDVLGGFLPLLLGSGPLAALVKGGSESRSTAHTDLHTSRDIQCTDLLPAQESKSESADAPSIVNSTCIVNTNSSEQIYTDVISSFLNGQARRKQCSFSPELLPVLQNHCIRAFLLVVGGGLKNINNALQDHSCCCAVEQALQKRLEEMERRLMEHIDQRLSALQDSLESRVLSALPHSVQTGKSHCSCRTVLLNGDI
uniref:Si:rp71-19m20.1 n=1 Tax=Lepisosteus oculatus TaxID=7918 RepID=W5MNT2_LEPOC